MLSWDIPYLPDFLCDHTLVSKEEASRLDEIHLRWSQFVSSLSTWCDAAVFALCFHSSKGRLKIKFVANADESRNNEILRKEISTLLRATRLTSRRPKQWNDGRPFQDDWLGSDAAIAEVRQQISREIWYPKASFLESDDAASLLNEVGRENLSCPPIVLPWWEANGPFLLPIEALLDDEEPSSLVVFLRPTRLLPIERRWLSLMAQEADSQRDQSVQPIGRASTARQSDPVAMVASRLYAAFLKRVFIDGFMVTCIAAASRGRVDRVRALASAVAAVLRESTRRDSNGKDEWLPVGADIHVLTGSAKERTRDQAILDLLNNGAFPRPTKEDPLRRIPYLADAVGAAAAFRLPINVRRGVPGIEVRQQVPDFHPGARVEQSSPGSLVLGRVKDGGLLTIPFEDLSKHALITGFTGSGKTQTVLGILHQAWCNDRRTPFLVIEAAKQEYRGLLGVTEFRESLRVFTAGNETCLPIRLNPFELLPDVRVEAHISRLQVCLEASIPAIGPSSSVIAEALLDAYAACVWMLTDVYPREGVPKRRFPTLALFVAKLEEVLRKREYAGDVADNLRAAIVGRFQPLLRGSKGAMLNCERTDPPLHELFVAPTVIELGDLNIDDKSLITMFLLAFLREHRESNPSVAGELCHLTVVEEAHNVLADFGESVTGGDATAADTRRKTVEAFCTLLTEIRSFGEGLIIADQSPTKLAKDAIRNTNLQIAHQLRDAEDRERIAAAMIMDEVQRDFIGKLVPGQAAMFRTGLEKATFVSFPAYSPGPRTTDRINEIADKTLRSREQGRYLGWGFVTRLSDAELRRRIAVAHRKLQRQDLILPFEQCQPCRAKCLFRDEVFSALSVETVSSFHRWFSEDYTNLGLSVTKRWETLHRLLAERLTLAGIPTAPDAAWCLLVHGWNIGLEAEAEFVPLRNELHSRLLDHWNRQSNQVAAPNSNRVQE